MYSAEYYGNHWALRSQANFKELATELRRNDKALLYRIKLHIQSEREVDQHQMQSNQTTQRQSNRERIQHKRQQRRQAKVCETIQGANARRAECTLQQQREEWEETQEIILEEIENKREKIALNEQKLMQETEELEQEWNRLTIAELKLDHEKRRRIAARANQQKITMEIDDVGGKIKSRKCC